MKKILKKIVNVTNRVIEKTEWYDDFWGGVTKFWRIRPHYYDVVNLGSNSGKYAFSYETSGVSGFNMAVGPQSLLHDYAILKNYFSYVKQRGIVIIPLSPFSCLISNYSKASNLKYYTMLHPATIFDFDEQERIKALRIKQNPFKAMPSRCIVNTMKEAMKRCLPRKRKVDYDVHADSMISMWKKQFGIDDLNKELSLKHQRELNQRANDLRQMIDFCLERELRPVLMVPPVHKSLQGRFSPDFKRHYIYDFLEVVDRPDIPFFDFLDCTEFSEDKYFTNSFFMSRIGTRQFTNHFISTITGK